MTFGELIDQHQIEILRYLVRVTGDRTEADDLFQDTFLRAFQAFGRLRPGSNHRAWLYRIATNVFLNHRRAHRRRREIELTEEVERRRSTRGVKTERPLLVLAFHHALRHLSRRQRAAFVQRNLQGLSYEQIANALGCTSAAARAHVYQAARHLKRELGMGKIL